MLAIADGAKAATFQKKPNHFFSEPRPSPRVRRRRKRLQFFARNHDHFVAIEVCFVQLFSCFQQPHSEVASKPFHRLVANQSIIQNLTVIAFPQVAMRQWIDRDGNAFGRSVAKGELDNPAVSTAEQALIIPGRGRAQVIWVDAVIEHCRMRGIGRTGRLLWHSAISKRRMYCDSCRCPCPGTCCLDRQGINRRRNVDDQRISRQTYTCAPFHRGSQKHG